MPQLNTEQPGLAPGTRLQPHQRDAIARALDSRRLLVYHGLGSGKTLTAIAAAEAMKARDKSDYGVILPASLRGNFQKELDKFAPGSRPPALSYTEVGMGKTFPEPSPRTLIFDEAHRLRNPDGAGAGKSITMANRARNALLLTGTPIVNGPADLAPLISILNKKRMSRDEFERRFISTKEVRPSFVDSVFRGMKPGVVTDLNDESGLRDILRGRVHYHPSRPPEGVRVADEEIKVPLSSEQQAIHDAIYSRLSPNLRRKLRDNFPLSSDDLSNLKAFMTGGRQVGLSTRTFRNDSDPAAAFAQSTKLQAAITRLKSTLDSSPRHKALAFSNFITAGLEPYSAGLASAGIPHALYHGGMPPSARAQALNSYNAGQTRALLLGPAGGEGISTKGTNLIQLLDPHWHETRGRQAEGRGLRFDSHADLPDELKSVNIQRFVSTPARPDDRKPTADQVLSRLSSEKEKLHERFLRVLREEGTT